MVLQPTLLAHPSQLSRLGRRLSKLRETVCITAFNRVLTWSRTGKLFETSSLITITFVRGVPTPSRLRRPGSHRLVIPMRAQSGFNSRSGRVMNPCPLGTYVSIAFCLRSCTILGSSLLHEEPRPTGAELGLSSYATMTNGCRWGQVLIRCVVRPGCHPSRRALVRAGDVRRMFCKMMVPRSWSRRLSTPANPGQSLIRVPECQDRQSDVRYMEDLAVPLEIRYVASRLPQH